MQQRKQLHLSPNDQGNQGFKFAILVAPFMSRSSQHAKWFSLGQGENGEKHERTAAAAVCSKVEIPTLHVMGETDKVIEKEMSEHILDFFQDPEILVHPGGHFVPATGAQKKVYVDFLARMKDICLKEDKK